MIRKIILLLILLPLFGCLNPTEPKMTSVMSSCETPDFSDFNSCVQRNYARHPDASTVRALYAQLNAIEEDQQNGKISQIKAKAMAYTAYDATVGAGNRPATHAPLGRGSGLVTLINLRASPLAIKDPTQGPLPPYPLYILSLCHRLGFVVCKPQYDT
jgi:hypothetical protein